MKPPKPKLRPRQAVPLPRPRPSVNVMPRLRGLLAPDAPAETGGGLLQPQGILDGPQLAQAQADLDAPAQGNAAPGGGMADIWKAIVQGLIEGQIPPDEARQYLQQDMQAGPSPPPPAFTSPTGQYR